MRTVTFSAATWRLTLGGIELRYSPQIESADSTAVLACYAAHLASDSDACVDSRSKQGLAAPADPMTLLARQSQIVACRDRPQMFGGVLQQYLRVERRCGDDT